MRAVPKVSVIIVNWNVRGLLQKNLARLFALADQEMLEVIVIDNGSADDSVHMLKQEFPQVHLIRNESNRGFAFACNQGLRLAKGEIFLLLNPDMLVGEGAIKHVYDTLTQRAEIGVMGVRLVREDGSGVASVRRDPGFLDQAAILLKLPHLFPNIVDRYLAKDFDDTKSQNVDQVRGSFFAFRRDVLDRVGFFDADNFFIWFEEVDFCKRVRQLGLRIWYSADVSCTDLVGRSFVQRTTRWKQYHLSRSMIRYFRKWQPAWQGWVLWTLRPLAILFGICADVLQKRSALWK